MYPFEMDLVFRHKRFELERHLRNATRGSGADSGHIEASAPRPRAESRLSQLVEMLRIRQIRNVLAN